MEPALGGLFLCPARNPAASLARYNQSANPSSKIRAFMKTPLAQLLLCAACALVAAVASAEKADRNKPINIESDALRYDDLKQTSVFTGNVVLTKGSIIIRGAQIEMRQDAEGYQFGVATAEPGKLAFFRQKRDGGDDYIEGEGELIEYDGRTDIVKLTKNAQLRRLHGAVLADEVTGAVIQYNNATDVFTVDGVAGKGATGGRVRAMLTPKAEPAAGAASASVQPGPVLRETTSLGKERK
jgi:lipopolysaccharide export system protein LptA